MSLFSYIRLTLALVFSYCFFIHYLGHKYLLIFNPSIHPQQIKKDFQQIFNLSSVNLNGQDFINREQYKWSQLDIKNIIQSEKQQQSIGLSLFDYKKKVSNYIFTFYNLYRVEIKLTDLGYDSFVEFKMITEEKPEISIMEKVSFRIPSILSQSQANQQNQQKLLKIKFSIKDFSINVSQFTTSEVINDKFSDGYVNEQLLYLSENKQKITQEDYRRFGSAKTITIFNINLKRADLQLNGNLTHITRNNQCFYNKKTYVLKQKCLGGYGNGKMHLNIFKKDYIDEESGHIYGDWIKQTLNLDNSRARTILVKYQSRKNYLNNLMQNIFSIQKPKFNHKAIEIDFIGFDKQQYYLKEDRIQKQKWLGMTLYQSYDKDGRLQSDQELENYLFINGNIHPIYTVDLDIILIREKLDVGQSIYFSHIAVDKHKLNKSITPNFNIKFDIFNITESNHRNFLDNEYIYTAYGSFSGWVDQLSVFQDPKLISYYQGTQEFCYVGFYNVTGKLTISKQIY